MVGLRARGSSTLSFHRAVRFGLQASMLVSFGDALAYPEAKKPSRNVSPFALLSVRANWREVALMTP